MQTNICLQAEKISLAYKDKTILQDINLQVPLGKISAIIGPNGSGKTTLLRILSGLIPPSGGQVFLYNKPLSNYRQKEIAQKIAFLPQRSAIPDNYTVLHLLEAGRFPHQSLIRKNINKDSEVIDWALDVTDMRAYKNQLLSKLSGGLQQRAWLAMVLCQQTPIIILDEPATYLDIKHQLQLLELIKSLNIQYHKTILWVLHDLSHAVQTSDYLFVLKQGRLIAKDTPQKIISSNILAQTFEVALAESYFKAHVSLTLQTL
ncbi:ABC transporter ATP-binding protein [Facilibium subflavum]|uniref:ABC transporter ATP-binding protein n=1 Tax=Facilibium subflavum TaxID=2219058 RepID=UPI000E65A13D|nr:ABC transporter ATP-binding protein [Facilibium subflavum]